MSANPHPLPRKVSTPSGVWLRRQQLQALTPTEHILSSASLAIETLGCDPLLAEALRKVEDARALVADWLEGKTQ